jgi:pimeloyl-ACP methyl ester carboxylesterase
VSFGFILQAPNNDAVIAIRGPSAFRVDPRFRIPCHEVPIPARRAGKTDDGFTARYNSLRVANASTRLVDAVAALQFDHAVDSLTICGHSLGGALATLLAFDVAANPIFKNPTIYTYASPRTEDALLHVPTTRFSRIPIVSPPRRYGSQATVCNLSRNTWRDSTS